MHVLESAEVKGVSSGHDEQLAAEVAFTTILPVGQEAKQDDESEALYDPTPQRKHP